MRLQLGIAMLSAALAAACPGFAHAGPEEFDTGTATVSCSNWSTKSSTDPAVDLDADFGEEAVTLLFEDGLPRGGALPPLTDVFDQDTFRRTARPSVRKTSVSEDSYAYRLVSGELVDNLTFTGLETGAPLLYWQRLRPADGTIYETFIVAGCTRS